MLHLKVLNRWPFKLETEFARLMSKWNFDLVHALPRVSELGRSCATASHRVCCFAIFYIGMRRTVRDFYCESRVDKPRPRMVRRFNFYGVLLIPGKNVRRFLFFSVCSPAPSKDRESVWKAFSPTVDLPKRIVGFDRNVREPFFHARARASAIGVHQSIE